MRSGKDWILMLLPCLFLSSEVFDEDWIRRLANQDHSCPLCVQCFDFEFNLKTNVLTWVRDGLEPKQQ